MAEDTIRIAECPLCGESHQYSMKVNREIISGLATQPQSFRQVSFQREFACPKTKDGFEGTITLTETTMMPIVSVEILGIHQED